jgi:hypothetical protein
MRDESLFHLIPSAHAQNTRHWDTENHHTVYTYEVPLHDKSECVVRSWWSQNNWTDIILLHAEVAALKSQVKVVPVLN